jgi:hypothetical protein
LADTAVVEAGCNAHGRRKFRDAEATQPVLAAEGGAFIGAMYGAEEKAQKLDLRGSALRKYRQQHIRSIARDFERWLDAVKPTLLPSEPLAAAIAYYKNHRDALFRFIDDPLVPIDNSPTEREFQNVPKLRLNMLFARSTEGAHRACVLLGIMATCRALRVPAQAYLAWAFERLGAHRYVFDIARGTDTRCIQEDARIASPRPRAATVGRAGRPLSPARCPHASASRPILPERPSAIIPPSLIGHSAPASS